MTIQEITDSRQWNNFLLGLNPNTFLQSWEWGQLQKQSGEGVRYLGLFEADQQIGAALLITVQAQRGRHLLCPHGPLFATESLTRQHLPAFVDYCRRLASLDKAVALKVAPLLITNPKNTQAFQNLGFRPAPLHVHAERTWNLDITHGEDELLANMRKTTRHAIKKAGQSQVAIDITTSSNIVNRFLPLYHATRHRHHFVPFTKDFLKQQLNIFGRTGRVFAVFASHRGRDTSAAILIHFGSTVFYHHGASLHTGDNIPASHLVQWHAIKEAKRRGATRYNFWGIAPPEPGEGARRRWRASPHPFAGITVFKQGFGGRATPYLHAQDLALSPLYYKLWLVETMRKYRRRF